jgi:hypothetical protein
LYDYNDDIDNACKNIKLPESFYVALKENELKILNAQ